MTTQAQKRTRIDPAATLPPTTTNGTKKASTAPLALAQAFIKSHISSLHPEIGSVMETHGLDFVLKMSKLYNKQRQLTKMETDEEFIPRSARFEFKLHPSKQATQAPSYNDLQVDIDSSVKDMKQLFKGYIIRLLRIENELASQQLLIDLASSLRQVIEAFKVGHDTSPSADIIAATIIDQHHETLFEFIPGATVQKFQAEYIKLHSLNTWPNAHVAPSATGTQPSASQNASPFFQNYVNNRNRNHTTTTDNTMNIQEQPTPMSQPAATGTTTLCQTIHTAFKAVFVTAWTSYQDQIKKNEITLQIKRLKTNRDLEKSAEDTAITIDEDGSAPPELIAELVTKKTNEATRPLKKEIADLSNQIQQLLSLTKNDKRGRGGATKTNTPTKGTRRNKGSRDSDNNSNKSRERSRSPVRKKVTKKGKGKGNSGGARNNATPRKPGRSRPRGGRRQSTRK